MWPQCLSKNLKYWLPLCQVDNVATALGRGREPPDVMSLCYADTSLPDLLGRPSLRYTE